MVPRLKTLIILVSGLAWVGCTPPPNLHPDADAGPTDATSAAIDADLRDDDHLFSDQRVLEIDLTLSSQAIGSLRAKPRQWVCGHLRAEGQDHAIAVRLKGSASFRSIDSKPALKIRWKKECGSQGTLFGRTRLTLNNLVQDRSSVREMLAYQVYREAGVPAPRTGMAWLRINDLDYGLYANIEDVDRTMLGRHFDDPSGPLYEADVEVDVKPGDLWEYELDEGPSDSRWRLADLIAQANQDGDRVFFGPGPHIDMDAFATVLAASAVTGDWDGYWKPNNYRLYFDPREELWYVLPWGLDQAWYKDMTAFDGDSVLFGKCLSSPRCLQSYISELRRVLDLTDELDLQARIDHWRVLVDEKAVEDPRRSYSLVEMQWARRSLPVRIRSHRDRLRRQLQCWSDPEAIDPSSDPSLYLDADGDGYAACSSDCDDNDGQINPIATELCNGIDDDCNGLVDDSDSCDCQPLLTDDAYFAMCSAPLNWHDARARCQQMGGDLAYFDSAEQNFEVWTELRSAFGNHWLIGIQDQVAEGDYRWADGAVPSFQRWHWTEPNNWGGEDCGELSMRSDAAWNDINCMTPRPFLCRSTPGGVER